MCSSRKDKAKKLLLEYICTKDQVNFLVHYIKTGNCGMSCVTCQMFIWNIDTCPFKIFLGYDKK